MNTNTNANNQNPNPSPITNDNFDFYLSQTNKIKPKSLKKIDIIHLIRSNRVAELNELLKDISQEDFEENDYFDFNKDELKLIKHLFTIINTYRADFVMSWNMPFDIPEDFNPCQETEEDPMEEVNGIEEVFE